MTKQTHLLFPVETLRAIGALVVVFHHLMFINHPQDAGLYLFPDADVRREFGVGPQGLNLLFVVSGLVIFYTLLKSNYNIKQFPRFILRRMLRIFPPFWITIILFSLVPFLYHSATFYSVNQLLLNATLLVDLFEGEKWMNPVFVSLKLEFIFYIGVGLLAWLLKRRIEFVWLFTVLGIVGSYFFWNDSFMIKLPFFLLGMNLSYFFLNPDSKKYLVGVIMLVLFVGIQYSIYDFASVILTLVILLFTKRPTRIIEQISLRSYSLYLTHGLSVILVSTWLFGKGYNLLVIIPVAVISATVFTLVFYRWVEKPFVQLSRHFR